MRKFMTKKFVEVETEHSSLDEQTSKNKEVKIFAFSVTLTKVHFQTGKDLNNQIDIMIHSLSTSVIP